MLEKDMTPLAKELWQRILDERDSKERLARFNAMSKFEQEIFVVVHMQQGDSTPGGLLSLVAR